jgi:hypothetical protein
LLVRLTSASCQQERGSQSAVTFPHLLHEAEKSRSQFIKHCRSQCCEFVRKSLSISRLWFHYVTLKINYKYKANYSKKIYYLFCYLYVEVTKIVILFLLASGIGKCQYHSPSQPSHIHNETSGSVQLKLSSHWSAVIFCCLLKLKVSFPFGCI